MGLNLDAVGKTTEPLVHRYRAEEAILYALSVGAKIGPELDYVYEARGPKVLPTYAVVPAFPALAELLKYVGGDVMGVVHAAQKIHLHKPFAPEGTLRTIGKVAGVYDLKRLAQVLYHTESRDEAGNLVCETEWSVIFRFDGGFGGPPPPKSERFRVPEGAPDFRVEEKTSPEQAALYRLNGDKNPLHIDPAVGEAVGFGRPILHGLCTYGFVGRAVLNELCGGDPTRLGTLSGQFRKPVWPGDTLVTEGWKDGSRVVLQTSVAERPGDPVFSNAYAELR